MFAPNKNIWCNHLMGNKEKLMKELQTISIRDLALKSGVSENVLHQIKRGSYTPSEERATMLLSIISSSDVIHIHERKKKEVPDEEVEDKHILAKMAMQIKELEDRIDDIKRAMVIVREVGRKK